jgi:glycosyltransferase involved in cell wall biosynthesis
VAPALAFVTPAAEDRATRLLVTAPGHNLWDERVLRTVHAGSRVHRCTLALEPGTLASATDVQRARERLGDGVELLPLPEWPKARGLSRLTRHLYAHRIARQARALAPDVVHVHESGILGLMIAARVRKALPRARIVFDYHDWIPDEVAASVRNVPALYALDLRTWMMRLRRMARAVDVAVCISPGQAEWTRRELGIPRTVVVQNVRDAPCGARFGQPEFRPRLVWAGHLMRVRRLEFVIDVLARLREGGTDAEFAVFGDLTEPDYADELRAYARARGVEAAVAFHGRYQGDAELLRHTGPGALGLTLAMAEKLPTGINRIASANKFFSYVAMGVPTLLDGSFRNMLDIAEQAGAGAEFHDVDSCVAAARRIWDTPGLWQRMSEAARSLAHAYSSEAAVDVLEALYREPLR